MDKSSKKLFQEFPPVETSKWEAAIEKDLKGADYEKRLIWKSPDQIPVKPYYRSSDLETLPEAANPGEFPFTRGNSVDTNGWSIRQEVVFETVEQCAQKIRHKGNRGVNAIELRGEFSQKELVNLLAELQDLKPEIHYHDVQAELVLAAYNEVVNTSGWKAEDLVGSLGVDPLGEFILTGRLDNEEEQFDQVAKYLEAAANFPNLKVIVIHGTHFHNAGSNAIQALAFSLAMANEYIDAMIDRGISIELMAEKMSFSLAVAANYFFELAKFRSCRSLWALLVDAYEPKDLKACQAYIHAESSRWNKTVYDPHVNLLRTTTEAMSAVIGGIDSLTIHPFDKNYAEANEFSERLARNQQLLLRDEAYLDKVIDPAAGSYYIENLTDTLTQSAWKLFQEVEGKGGFIDSFLEGFVQDAITSIAEQRDTRVAQRKYVLLGTNQYPNAQEKVKDFCNPEDIKSKIVDPTDAQAQPLIPYRAAEGFELLRLQTELANKQPKVFLLTIGNLTMRKARAAFASNFFACAGYEIIDNLGFETVEEGVNEAHDLKADLIVLCSSDDEYPSFAKELIQHNTNTELVIAGYPKAHMDTLKEMGYTHFIHVKSNVLETLKGFNLLLGLAE